jgi:Domain of Unknown Function (DUF1080).
MKKHLSFFIGGLLLLTAIPMSAQMNAQTIELFNGKDLTGWELVTEDPNVAKDVFSVKDNLIYIKGSPFGYMQTDKEFDNFHFYVEWRWPEKATNSGIFLLTQNDKKVWSNCIEVQLKSGFAGDLVLMAGADMQEFVLPPGEERPAFPVLKRKVESVENPAGEWNNAEIFCFNGYVSVYINGVFQNMGTATLHKKGRIALQSEGGPIQFRHVRITPFSFQ